MRSPAPILLVALAACGDSAARQDDPPEPPNHPPHAVAAFAPSVVAGDLIPGDTIALDGSQSSDPDGDELRFSWTFVVRPPGSEAAFSEALVASPNLTLDRAGVYELWLTVTDARGLSDTAALSLEIRGDGKRNHPPVAVVKLADGLAGKVIRPGTKVIADGSASSDEDEDPLTFSWQLSSRPAGSSAALESLGESAVVLADRPGSYVVLLTVTDPHGAKGESSLTFEVKENHPPHADAQLAPAFRNVRISEGLKIQLDATGSTDPDGDPLSYAWLLGARPAGSSAVLDRTDVPQPWLLLDREGEYALTLTVRDPDGLPATAELHLRALAHYDDVPFEVTVSNVQGPCPFSVSPALNGHLTVDRNDPEVVFHFATSTFNGTIDAQDHFVVTLRQEFDYVDGCHWQSIDTVDGTFTSPDTFEASHHYDESVLRGTNCAGPCHVTAHLHGERRR